MRGREIGRDRASQSHSLSQRGCCSGREGEAEIDKYSIQWETDFYPVRVLGGIVLAL